MNAIVEMRPIGALTSAQANSRMAVADIISHVSLVQEVMRAVMKKDVHFGIIPGTDKPTLYKPGAEVLCMAFRIADSYDVEDLSVEGVIRYRVTCTGMHQINGVVLGAGMGEASSGEEKYKWRKAYEPEFNVTPENMRRKKSGKNYETMQIRTEPADLANTILKMANKRAKMAMVLNVTAASDCFSQDLEDMDDALRDHLIRRPGDTEATSKPQLPTYTDADFRSNIPVWKKHIDSGKVNAEGVIAKVILIATLTEDQKTEIRKLIRAEAPANQQQGE